MAKIREKNSKRYRVQISVSKETWEAYSANQQLAGQLKVEIDYSAEFSNWLSRQNEQVARDLQQLHKEQMAEPQAVGKVHNGDNSL